MKSLFHRFVQDLHLYFGLFVSPFVLVFAGSVFFLVHAWVPKPSSGNSTARIVSNLPIPADLAQLSGRPLIDALRPALKAAGVEGEVGWVQHLARENRLVTPVSLPGRLTTVTIDLAQRQASIQRRDTGLVDSLIMLHKSPGPHLAAIRMNWPLMRVWAWLADLTVWLVLFLTFSGLYLWCVLRAERKLGVALLAAGVMTFFALVYVLAF